MSSIPFTQTRKKSILKTLDVTASLTPYIKRIEALLENGKTIKSDFYKFILTNLSRFADVDKPLDLHKTKSYKEVLEFVCATLSYDLLSADSDNLCAFSVPFSPQVIYTTDALQNLVDADDKHTEVKEILEECLSETEMLRFIYSFVLQKLYDFESPVNNIYYAFADAVTGMQKVYLINIDLNFVELITHKEIPDLNLESLLKLMHRESDFQEIMQTLPLNNFTFEGFSILRFEDFRSQHLISNVENLISNRENKDLYEVYDGIIHSLKSVIQKNEIELGLLPFLKVNEEFIFDDYLNSRIVIAESMITDKAHHSIKSDELIKYFKNGKPLYFNDLSQVDETVFPFAKGLNAKGIVSLVLLPIVYNKKLTGLIELHAKSKAAISKSDIALLNIVLPQIGELFQTHINEFQFNIENVIKQNFTSLHPSVQWKFNETAWLFLKDNARDDAAAELRKIQFKEVYPLYGAIDIRNSTYERNLALQKDMLKHLNLLYQTLINVSKKIRLELIDEMLFQCEKWTTAVQDFINSAEEHGIDSFLCLEVEPLLQHLKENVPETVKIIDTYLDATDKNHGSTYENRKKLEKSITLINKVINNHLEFMVKDLQQAYPFYFEKFRTDGVEYDIYMGQSIAPNRPFDLLYLTNARLWQLKSMASIVRICHQLSPKLPTVLHTTNLIFAHSTPIDISFRNDERRLDVEGAYNIRYQVIKKRIDKVHVKDTKERLTQPGKIAIVYFNQKEAEDYFRFINSLIVQEVFTDSLEYLDLEDLQGVAGLKALRVGVNVD